MILYSTNILLNKNFSISTVQLLLEIFLFSLITSCTPKSISVDAGLSNNIKTISSGIHINSDEILNGYTDYVSYTNNQNVAVFLNSKDSIKNAVIKLFSINGTIVDSLMSSIHPQLIKNTEPWKNGYGYDTTFTYDPSKLESGVYLWEKKIPMIIKSNGDKQISLLYPSNTENAYCISGGLSMYSTPNAATIVSFSRPILLSTFSKSFLEWINLTNFRTNLNYIADIDLEDITILDNSKLLIIIGHSEYWTRNARINIDKFIENGHDVIILSGNNMWWQVRYDIKNKQLICYKDMTDPISDPLLKTINWFYSLLKYPIINSIGGDFNNGGYGLKTDSGWDGYKICRNESPLLEGTYLNKGNILSIPTCEYDGTPIKKFDSEGYPIIDNSNLKYYKSEIIGFDLGFRDVQTCGTFIVFQRTFTSGIVINASTTDWCSEYGIGGKDGDKIKIITRNMIEKLLNKKNIFSP